jgi:hypothetical protein
MRFGCLVPVLNGKYCDFCTTEKVFKLYPCANFIFNNMPVFQNGFGTWAACARCAELIDADRWAELTERSFRKFAKVHGPISRHDVVRLREQFHQVHLLFRENRRKPS